MIDSGISISTALAEQNELFQTQHICFDILLMCHVITNYIQYCKYVPPNYLLVYVPFSQFLCPPY